MPHTALIVKCIPKQKYPVFFNFGVPETITRKFHL